MSDSLKQSTHYRTGNGKRKTFRSGPAKSELAGSSDDPYLNNPVFRAALRHYKNKNWARANSLVGVLLRTYPGDKNLLIFQRTIQRNIDNQGYSYRNHRAYVAALGHLKRKEWQLGLKSVQALQEIYPGVQQIKGLRRALLNGARKEVSRKRLRLLSTFLLLTLLLFLLIALAYRYVRQPGSLAEILAPQASLNYPPHYLFSIHNIDQPVGVGLSPDMSRLYVTEMGGSRLVRAFDRDGKPLNSFAAPNTGIGERAPVYLSTDSTGQVYVSDRLQHALYVFDSEGAYLDTLLSPDLSLSEYIRQHAGGLPEGETVSYNLFQNVVYFQNSGQTAEKLLLPDLPVWSPLGVRIRQDDHLLLTDVSRDENSVIEIPLKEQTLPLSEISFDQEISRFGTSGDGSGELLYPNVAAADSRGRVYVSDGNNRRISVWDGEGVFLFDFGRGTGEGSLSLPRGLSIDWRDRLYVVDAVAQNVKVYDVSGTQPDFLFEFGDFGLGDGLFNYPNDIAIDSTGRLYIADRENNRIQVWSY